MMKIIFLSFFFAYAAVAGFPPTATVGSAGGAYKTTFNFNFANFPLTYSGTTATLGTLALAGGGTGQTTKAAAFDALSPMTTSGDIIYGGASGTGTRLAKGSDGNVLTLASGVPSWAAAGGGTSYSWVGNHGTDCFWAKTAAGYGNPSAADSSCTFTEVQNTNMGTVISYNNGTPNQNFPGVTFTPPVTGNYFFCMNLKQATHTQIQNMGYRLTDGTTVIAQGYGSTAITAEADPFMVNLCGIWNAASLSSVSIRLQMDNFSGSGSQNIYPLIQWSFFKVN